MRTEGEEFLQRRGGGQEGGDEQAGMSRLLPPLSFGIQRENDPNLRAVWSRKQSGHENVGLLIGQLHADCEGTGAEYGAFGWGNGTESIIRGREGWQKL